jgi:hypothetical protein
MSCRKVFHAFATSAGWPIADATNCFRFVAISCHACRSQLLQSLHPHFGAAHVAIHPCWSCNDSLPQSFSISKGDRNASLIVPRKTAPRAISADLSTHRLEMCLDFRNGLNFAIDASLFRHLARTLRGIFPGPGSPILLPPRPLSPRRPH